MAKKILLFADGTGNARTAQFRTNVWKLYNAVDSTPGSGQIAYYHDGVGTSSIAPLRMLGGIFGWGLARNVKELYAFLCLNLTSVDDEIHLFGFSRGAFTVRILAGLIAAEGVRPITDEAALADWVTEAFRRYRRERWLKHQEVGCIRRFLFKHLISTRHKRPWDGEPLKPNIQLVGVWDTVAAYGGPIVEMVRGFDRWVIPLSMADYKLNPKIRHGRHALALDEEREAFLPLPWDEVGSENRIKQVWFPGVHSDVGGGYPDEGLSSVPLAWMMDEAIGLGIKFLPGAVNDIRQAVNALAPMHDSRSGVAIAYRYQPRNINSLMGLTPNSTIRDPASGKDALMDRVIVHQSVLERRKTPDYVPIVLPTAFYSEIGEEIQLSSDHRDEIWRLVTLRQWAQRFLLVTGMAALFAPLYFAEFFKFPNQGLSPLLGAILNFIPVLPAWSKAAYASAGWQLIIFAVFIGVWVAIGERYRVRINKLSAKMWSEPPPVTPGEPHEAKPPKANGFLDTQRLIIRILRWRILPAVFGLSYYTIAFFVALSVGVQVYLGWREWKGGLCTGPETSESETADATQSKALKFNLSQPCQRLGFTVNEGNQYLVKITPHDWKDDVDPAAQKLRAPVKTDPAGFTYVRSFSERLSDKDETRNHKIFWALEGAAVHFFGIATRREVSAHWFVPVIAIRNGSWLYKAILHPRAGDDKSYYARFVAPADGTTWIYVNDTILPFLGDDFFYKNNSGSADVVITSEH